MNFSIERTKAARDDLLEIWLRIAAEDMVAADRQLQRIDDAIAALANHPRIGPSRDDLHKGLRTVLRTPHLIFYDIDEQLRVVRVIRIIDARRDLEAVFHS